MGVDRPAVARVVPECKAAVCPLHPRRREATADGHGEQHLLEFEGNALKGRMFASLAECRDSPLYWEADGRWEQEPIWRLAIPGLHQIFRIETD